MSDKELYDKLNNVSNHIYELFLELVKSEVYGGWGPTKLQKMIKQERGWLLPGSNPEESSRLTQGVFFLCFAGVSCGLIKCHSLAKDKGKAAFIILVIKDWEKHWVERSNEAYQNFALIDPYDEPLFFGKNVKKYLDGSVLKSSFPKYEKIFESVTLNENYNEKYEVSNVFMDSCEFNPTYNSELITHINELFSKSIILPKSHL